MKEFKHKKPQKRKKKKVEEEKAGPTSDVIQEWKVGDRIEGNFEGQGLFYPGAISKVRFWPLFFENSSAVVLISSGCSNVV